MLCSYNQVEAQKDTIINRYREYLFRNEAVEDVEQWATTLNENHQWTDIKYDDVEPSNWKVSKHLMRVRVLSLAWANPQSSYYHNETLWNTISPALDHWLEKRYKSSNWWHNEIGIPQFMRDIIILIGDKLTTDQYKQALEVLAQHRVRGTGGNLVWTADLGIHYAALTNNNELLKRYSDLIKDEIKITTGDGIQPDYSFHQHGSRLQMYHYGKAYFWESVRLAWQLRDTPWAFPEDKINILSDLALRGWQWMARGINTVPGTIDRAASRDGELKSADMRKLIPYLSELSPKNSTAFEKMNIIENGVGALNGFIYYPYSDFTAYHQKDFSFFLKTISNRTLATESINNENLKGRLLNNGDGYLIKNGTEYYNLMPVWDWELLPGITNYKGKGMIARQNFAGGVGDKDFGLTAMDYRVEDKVNKQTLSAHKIWVCHDDLVVCLIADIQTENIQNEVLTALDQCRWQGDVTVNETGNVLDEGTHNMKGVKWIHHNGFGYIPIGSADINLNLNTVTGTWASINHSQSSKPITEKVFKPVIVHHIVNSRSESTGYVLASCKTPQHVRKLAANPEWNVLSNDKNCQAVSFKDKTLAVAFFTAGSLKIKNAELIADKPCLMLISRDKLYVSDPNHIGGMIKIRWKNKVLDIDVPKDGATSEGVAFNF